MAKDKKVLIINFILFLAILIQSITLVMQIRDRREFLQEAEQRQLETSRRIAELEGELEQRGAETREQRKTLKDKKVEITYFVLFLAILFQSIALVMGIRRRRELSEKQDRRQLETSRRIAEVQEAQTQPRDND